MKRYKSLFTLLACWIVIHSCATSQIYGWRKRHPAVGMTVALNPLNPNTIYAEGSQGVIDVSFDRGRTWPLHMNPGTSSIRQILVHPRDTLTILCASGSDVPGMLRTTDYGTTWETVLPGYHIDGESMTYDPLHPDTIYAGQFAVGKVFRSLDRGKTWTYQGTANDLLCAIAVRPDSANILYAGTGGGTISKSTNYGFTWRMVKPSYGATEAPKICISPSNPLVAYATSFGGVDTSLGVWKTTDGGESWIKTGAPNRSMWSLDIHPANENIVYTGTFDGGVATIFRTTDGGATWNALPPGLPNLSDNWSLKIHPLNPNRVWVALTMGSFGFNGIYCYDSTFTGITGHVLDAGTHDTISNGYLSVTTTGDSIDLGATGGTFVLGNFEGDLSSSVNAHVQAFPYYLAAQSLDFVQDTIIAQDIYLQKLARRSISGTVRDSALQMPRRANVLLYQATSVGSAVIAESTDVTGSFLFDSMYVSQPPVVQYDRILVQPEIPFAYTTLKPVLLDTTNLAVSLQLVNADVLIVSAADSGIYSPYYEAALESIGTSFNDWNSLVQGAVPLSRGPEFRKKSIIFYTGDKHTPLSQSDHDSIVACLNLGCNLFLTGQDIAEMNDSTELLKNYLRIGFGGNSTFSFVTGLSGLFFHVEFSTTTAAGANNQTSRDILSTLDPNVIPQMGYGSGIRGTAGVKIDSVGAGGKAIVCGFGFEAVATTTSRMSVMQKVMEYFESPLVVGVRDGSPAVPSAFALAQNYPNPFNPGTAIQYSLPGREYVSLRVFNVLGQEVAMLVNGVQDAGYKTATWNAGAVPSGVYFARLVVSSSEGKILFTQTRKLSLLK